MRDYSFGVLLCSGVTNGEREKRVSLAASVGLSIPGFYGQRTMTNEGAKRNVVVVVIVRLSKIHVIRHCFIGNERYDV